MSMYVAVPVAALLCPGPGPGPGPFSRQYLSLNSFRVCILT